MKMNSRFIISVLCVFISIVAIAQKPKLTPKLVKNNPEYIYGEGSGRTMEEAKVRAVNDFMMKIKVYLRGNQVIRDRAQAENHEIAEYSLMESETQVSTNGKINNLEYLPVKDLPNEKIQICYIKRTDFESQLENRKNKVLGFVRDATEALDNIRLDDALKFLSWAYCLLVDLPNYEEISFVDTAGEKRFLIDWIPQTLDRILGNLDIKILSRRNGYIDFYLTYKDKQVSSVDFRVIKGFTSSNVSAKDGMAQVEYRNNNATQVQIEYEYLYKEKARLDVKEAVGAHGDMLRPKGVKIVLPLETEIVDNKLITQYQAVVADSCSKAISTLQIDSTNTMVCAETIDEVIDAIRNRDYLVVRNCFTNEGYEMFNQLINRGHASIMGEPKPQFYKALDKIVCRSIPMHFSFDNNVREFKEDVTFTFNRNNKIESIAFALDKKSRSDIFNINSWPDSVRMVIVNFLENYQTAFALKRLEYIRNIFSDDALIITGHVMKTAPKVMMENSKYIDNEDNYYVKYTKKDKQQYISDLERCFRSNEYINIHFADTEARRFGSNRGERYGILIHQDYYSSTYSDTGYLFLVVSFDNPNQPMIEIRTWQPNRDPSVHKNRIAKFDINNKYWGLIHSGNI